MDWINIVAPSALAILTVLIVTRLPSFYPALTNNSLLLEEQIETLQIRYDELYKENIRVRDQLQRVLIESATQRREWDEERRKLAARIRELESRAGVDPTEDIQSRVLGIWPSIDLGYDVERQAYHNAGFEYHSLIGENATRIKVIEEIDRHADVRILNIGGHGTPDGILLADGISSARFWTDALQSLPELETVLLMACESDAVGDELISIGIPFVISVQREIENEDALSFVRLFAKWLGKTDDVRRSFRVARSSLSPEGFDMIRIREGELETMK